jgi:shikimate dehydrogenase
MGWPVAHSKSPALHGYWLREKGIDGAYVPLAVPPADLATALRALPAMGFAGVNLTVPHKEAALTLVDEADETARRIGAVNTVTVRDRRVLGTNTDAYGFLANLRHAVPQFRIAAGAVVVLGAGGAARAICAGLLSEGCPEIRLVNRGEERARALAAKFDKRIVVHPWAARAAVLADAALLVNTTTLGMTGQPPLDLDLGRLPTTSAVYDIVYVPLETPLLAKARSRGHSVVDGLGMLLYQAQPAFAAWFGVTPDVTPALRDLVAGMTSVSS